MRWIFSLGAIVGIAGLAGCPSGGNGRTKNGPGPIAPAEIQVDLQSIPTKIDTTASAPTEGNSPDKRSPVLDILKAENEREIAALKTQKDPAYYLAYQLVEQRVVNLEAEGGALIADSDDTARNLDVEVRVGSPKLDNTRALADDNNGLNAPLTRRGVVPFGEDKQAIANALWLETDRRYREAVVAYGYVRQDQATLKARDPVDDFSSAPAEIYIEKPAELKFDKQQWIDRLKRCSAKALKEPATRGTCQVLFQLNTAYFVNSEGTQLQLSWTNAQFSVSVGVKADDGMNLSRLEQRFGRTPADLPTDADIDTMIKEVTTDLDALDDAPLAEPYVGPAILEGRASGVFFHEVFGHRIEGHRQKDKTGGQTFASYVGRDIAPDWLTVFDNPSLMTLNGVQLNGFYRFDDEGVRAQRANLIDNGKLVGFVMSRNPIKGFEKSNGHGRHSPGLPPVARQGNLVVEASKTVPRADLEKMLIEEIKRQKRPYGMIFTDISGGFTNTSAFAPQAFKVNPVMAYRIYADGRKELVRGIDMSGTPLVALQSIRAASREVETFNGVCGAESGWVPVSASAPSLLLEKIEVEKGFVPSDRPPVLQPPAIRDTHQHGGPR
ncbi:MAG: peptidase U62 [Deltaproteobacteria bacterium]|nr:peptidase U62 [Deltaproteobacteria bacterium]MDQ3295180.1 metallopeptidase TldD-related protein [Myxococcota bacterium]